MRRKNLSCLENSINRTLDLLYRWYGFAFVKLTNTEKQFASFRYLVMQEKQCDACK